MICCSLTRRHLQGCRIHIAGPDLKNLRHVLRVKSPGPKKHDEKWQEFLVLLLKKIQ